MSNILLGLAVLPSFVLGWYIYYKDKMGKEPTGLLISLLLGGVGSIVITLILSSILGTIFPVFGNDEYTNELEMVLGVFLGVALVEEFSKWIVLTIRTWKNKEFDHIFDAIVYAVFVTLGFATLENIMYVFTFDSIGTALMRAIVSVPGHVFDAILMGAFYGEAKRAQINNKPGAMIFNIILSLVIPALAHGFFDYILFLDSITALIIFIGYVIVLYIISFIVVNQVAKTKYNFQELICPRCGNASDGYFCMKCGTRIK